MVMTVANPSTLSLIAALLFCVPAAADEVRTKDGRTLIGPTKVLEKVVIVDTADGKVRIPIADVLRIRSDEMLRAELDKLASSASSDTIHGQLSLARSARGYGLSTEMWTYLDRCLEISKKKQHKPRHMSAFLASLEPEILHRRLRKASTEVKVKVKELLYRVRPKQSAAKIAAIEAILAELDGAEKHLYTAARSMGKKQQRLSALRAIEARGGTKNQHFLFRTSIYESEPSLRLEAMNMARQAKLADTAVAYLAQGLTHANPHVRIRTAQAYEMLASNNAVELLVHAGPVAAATSLAGGSTRGHIAIINQQAYVRDFDVEVAHAAFIADPKIGVLQSGMKLEVQVFGTSTVRTQIVDSYRHALRKLAGRDPGPKTSTWSGWYGKLRTEGIVAASIPVKHALGTAFAAGGKRAATPAARGGVSAAQPCTPLTGTGTTITGEKVDVTLQPSKPQQLPTPTRRQPVTHRGSPPVTPARSIPVRSAPPQIRRR